MRTDMHKVICERPRLGSCGPWKRSGPKNVPLDALPRYQSMRGAHTDRKEFGENLAPLRRWLLAQVGRPWDEVYSEACKVIKPDSVVRNHIKFHLLGMVMRHTLLHYVQIGSVLSLLLVTGCASNRSDTVRTFAMAEHARSSKPSNPTRAARGSSIYEQTLHALAMIAPDGNYTTFTQAATAHELLERALSASTLKANEARGLDLLKSVSADAMVSLGCLQKIQEAYTPRAQAFLKQGQPYSLEALYRKIIEDIRENEAHLSHPEFRARLRAERDAWEGALAAVAQRIEAMERDYHQFLAVRQRDFVNQAADADFRFARTQYVAGKGPWYWVDDENIIARAVAPLERVLTTPEVHSSLRDQARDFRRTVYSELWQSQIDREMQSLLPPYHRESNYPAFSDEAMRTFVGYHFTQTGRVTVKQ